MAISKLILNGEVQMDVTSDTVIASSLLSGKTATKNDGTKITGNIASKSSTDLTISGATVTAPAGFYANAASKAVATTTHPNPSASITSSTGVVTASHTQETGYVTGGTTTGTLNLTTQAGKTVTPTESAQTAVASYRWTTGNVNVAAISSTYVGTGITTRSSTNLTANGSVVTAPAGYYSAAATKSIAAGSAFPPATTITKAPTFSMNSSTGVVTASYNGSSSITPTVNAGYIATGTAGTISTTGTSTYQLTSKAAATIYPSTADQTIASYRWLTGTQTIKSVTTSNLTAANIAEGVIVKVGDTNNASRITQITGTHKGGSTYTATIINSSGSSNFPYAYVTYNNIKYYQLNDSFTFSVGDTLDIQVGGRFGNNDRIFIDGEKVGSASYSYTLPAHDIEIKLYVGNDSTAEIIFPTLSITENGTYDVGEYERADVSVVASGYTADQIAIRTMSGDISGSATTIANYAFASCSSLTTASFPSCTSIGSSAFYSCGSLTTASFPSCTTIGSYAFAYCYSLLSLYLLGSSIPTLAAVNTFSSTPISNYTTSTGGVYGSIFVPASLYSSYLTATNWSYYSSRFVSVQGG